MEAGTPEQGLVPLPVLPAFVLVLEKVAAALFVVAVVVEQVAEIPVGHCRPEGHSLVELLAPVVRGSSYAHELAQKLYSACGPRS